MGSVPGYMSNVGVTRILPVKVKLPLMAYSDVSAKLHLNHLKWPIHEVLASL